MLAFAFALGLLAPGRALGVRAWVIDLATAAVPLLIFVAVRIALGGFALTHPRY